MTVNLGEAGALITGASSGIGKSIAQRLGAAGMDLWLVGRNDAALDAVAHAIADAGGRMARTVAIDIAIPGALATVIAEIDHARFHALINCAGVMYPEPILDADPNRWRELFNINVLAPLEATQAAVAKMRGQGTPGHIVNFSSLTARWDAGGVYGATKAAIEMIGRTLRKELEQDDIRVTTIVPGGFATQLTRGFTAEILDHVSAKIKTMGVPMDKVIGDSEHIARIVQYVLEQPVDINISEIVIRPPVDLTL